MERIIQAATVEVLKRTEVNRIIKIAAVDSRNIPVGVHILPIQRIKC